MTKKSKTIEKEHQNIIETLIKFKDSIAFRKQNKVGYRFSGKRMIEAAKQLARSKHIEIDFAEEKSGMDEIGYISVQKQDIEKLRKYIPNSTEGTLAA